MHRIDISRRVDILHDYEHLREFCVEFISLYPQYHLHAPTSLPTDAFPNDLSSPVSLPSRVSSDTHNAETNTSSSALNAPHKQFPTTTPSPSSRVVPSWYGKSSTDNGKTHAHPYSYYIGRSFRKRRLSKSLGDKRAKPRRVVRSNSDHAEVCFARCGYTICVCAFENT